MVHVPAPIQIPAIPEFASQEEKLDWLCARHDQLEFEIAELRIRNAIWQDQLFGRKSEKIRAQDEAIGQQRLFDTPVADDVTGPDVADEPQKPEPKRGRGQAKQRTHGRKPVNPALPTHVREHLPAETPCDAQGQPLVIVGWDERERLHHIPEQVVRLLDRYPIWGLSDTRETVETTPILPCIIPGGKLSDAFLCEIARRKYLLSQPLTRQLIDYNDLGAELAVSTMSNGMRALAAFLEPIQQALRTQILAHQVLHCDETTMRQQCDEHGIVQRYLWAVHAGRQVCFHYGTRAAAEIPLLLGLEPGAPPPGGPPRYALTDGYAAYDTPLAAAGIIHAGCWTHIRRDFKPLAPHFTQAAEVLREITALYHCEKQAQKTIDRDHLHGPAADACRLDHRQRLAQPAIDRIAGFVERYHHLYPPDTLIAQAFTTLRNQFHKLRIYASTGCVPIDNNQIERDMRRVAVGRKNYLFVGSEDAGSWCATLYSLIESTRLCGLDTRAYLLHAVAGLHAGTDPARLTPEALRTEIPKAKA